MQLSYAEPPVPDKQAQVFQEAASLGQQLITDATLDPREMLKDAVH